jgi:hypothetical protein
MGIVFFFFFNPSIVKVEVIRSFETSADFRSPIHRYIAVVNILFSLGVFCSALVVLMSSELENTCWEVAVA